MDDEWWLPEGVRSRRTPRHTTRRRTLLGLGLLVLAVFAVGIGVATLVVPTRTSHARPVTAAPLAVTPTPPARPAPPPPPSQPPATTTPVSSPVAPSPTPEAGARLTQTVTNLDARLAYDVPADWTVTGLAREPNSLKIPFSGVATASYTCSGTVYRSGVAGSGAAQAENATLAPREAAQTFAKVWASELYPSPAIRLGEPKTTPGGVVEVDAQVRAGGNDACAPTSGIVTVLAWPVPGGATMLMVTGATSGPAALHPVDAATVAAIASSARLLPPNH